MTSKWTLFAIALLAALTMALAGAVACGDDDDDDDDEVKHADIEACEERADEAFGDGCFDDETYQNEVYSECDRFPAAEDDTVAEALDCMDAVNDDCDDYDEAIDMYSDLIACMDQVFAETQG
ncbi:hypothetical protein K8I61_16320 [bacterium]|nr:hypothetical protein [bacterium]